LTENYIHLKIALLAALLWGLSQPAAAAHLIGGEISYECLGFTNGNPNSNSRRYAITIDVFRDCQSGGSEFDSPNFIVNMHVTIYDGNTAFGTFFLDGPEVERINIADNVNNPCIIIPPNVCVEQGRYRFEVDLPISSQSYHIVYQRCCRNNTITNILNPASAGSTYTVELTPLAQQTCNSSPRFRDYPPAILCAGQPFDYDFSATDADGDQLVYEFCNPYLGGGNQGGQGQPDGVAPDPDLPPPYNNVIFLAPTYTAANPLGPTAGLTFNTATGRMTGSPQFIGQFVVGICVSEYRNGVLLSTVRRDFQFNVTNCEVTVFADVTHDEVGANGSLLINSCGDTQVNIVNQSGQLAFINGYRWEFLVNGNLETATTRDLSFNFPGPGSYDGRMIVNPGSNGCTDTSLVQVNIFPNLDSDFSFAYDTCVAESVAFDNLSTTAGGQQIVRHQWSYGDGGTDTLVQSSHAYMAPGNYTVQLAITDENGCTATSSRVVNYFPVPNLIVIAPSSFIGCAPANIFFDNLSNPVDETYTFDWTFGDGGGSDQLSPTYLYEDVGIYDVALSITSPIGCVTDTVFTQLINIEPAPIPGFSVAPEVLTNFAPDITITDQSQFAYRWFYNFNNESTSLDPSPTYTFRDTGVAFITQIVTHPSGCLDSLTRFVDVKPEITFYFPNAFTPNGDGLNDVFKPKGFTRGFKSYSFQVWNRWGEPLFSSADPTQGWNGQKNNTGQDQTPGVYLYEAVLVGPRGGIERFKGFINLVR
jgi:gliding motility-associated-like protein